MAISQVNFINLSTISVDIEDTSYLSQYFNITEFIPTLGAGKNLLIINTTPLLSSSPNIQIECVDSKGNYLKIDEAIISNAVTGKQQYYYAINVDDTLTSGPGKLTVIGITNDNKKVRWTANVVINTNMETTSKIVFINKPELKVYPIITYVLNNTSVVTASISGSCISTAINPPKDFDITNQYNKNKLNYRIIDNNANFSCGMENFPLILNINKIKTYASYTTQSINDTATILIQNVVNKNTLELSEPYVYQNNKIAEIVSASYTCSYNDIVYNSDSFFTSSYATQSISLIPPITRYIKNSYALIGYTNLDSFSGKVQKHKIYKKSLSKSGDFILINDELFRPYELLADITTPNKAFQNLGTFYSQFHINNFWFTSSNAFNLEYDNTRFLNGMIISSSSPITGGYIIAKPNSSWINRDATYIPFNSAQNSVFTGNAYDSNYLHFYPNTSYTLTFNAGILNKNYSSSATLDFYITSSNSTVTNEVSYVFGKGIKIASISASFSGSNYLFNGLQSFDFSLSNELYGALVIYPNNFSTGLISDISITPSEKYGFSQGTYFVKVPFDVTTKNEASEITAELYDKDGVLAYNDLTTVQYFDPEGITTPIDLANIGSTLVVENISGSTLKIDKDAIIGGKLVVNNGITSSLGFYGTSSWAYSASFVTGSIFFGNNLALSASYAITSSNANSASYLIYSGIPNGTASYALTASYAMNGGGAVPKSIIGETYYITASLATNSLTSSYLFLKNSASFDYNSSNTNTTSTTILSEPTGNFNAAFFDYVITKGNNFRAGTLICGFSGSNINYTEYSTTDMGDTTPVTMSALLSSGNVLLVSNTPVGQVWNIKSIGRYL